MKENYTFFIASKREDLIILVTDLPSVASFLKAKHI
jgi:hypothetical protein